jgi:hypothetical protein
MAIFKGNNRETLSADFIESLRTEYVTIQGKIDNIGEFKFKVRGWLITIYSAFVYGAITSQITFILILPLGFFVVFVFQILEREQLRQQYKLQNRAKRIEYSLYVLTQKVYDDELTKNHDIRKVIKELESTPRIAIELLSAEQKKKSLRHHFYPSKFNEQVVWIKQSINRFLARKWRKLKEYWLFNVLYFSTFIMFVFIIYVPITNEKLEDDKEVSQINFNNSTKSERSNKLIIKKPMRSNIYVERVEDEMYSLVSQIDFGDVSDIDTYWGSLSEALLNLPLENWPGKPYKGAQVSDIINTIPFSGSEALCDLARKMEDLCDSGSSSTIGEESMDKLTSLAIKFETKFKSFLDRIEESINNE